MGGKGMTDYRYCTPEWLKISAESYQANPRFQQGLAKLTLKVFFNIKAEPAWGIDQDVIFGAFITQGDLEKLAFFSEEDAREEAEFILAATPQEWKRLLRKESKFVTDFLLGRVTLEQGSKVGILGIAHHADALIDALTPVPLQFPDEMSVEQLAEFRSYVDEFRRELGV
jgi:putative sterol carrier protein